MQSTATQQRHRRDASTYFGRLAARETEGTRLDQIDRRLAAAEAEIARAHRRIDDLWRATMDSVAVAPVDIAELRRALGEAGR